MKPDAIEALGPDDVRRIERLLKVFVAQAGARCALLLDRRGRSLAAVGDTNGIDETSFASLASADFEASDQLAALLGEPEFTALYHQGIHGSMYLSDIEAIAILAAIFDRRTTLGMVRLKTREVIPRLRAVLVAMQARPAPRGRLDEGWGDDAASEIDRLFAG
jgi:predicted regulator of Ras-like GTPase activity (Roadblock/LC7/MglB family)